MKGLKALSYNFYLLNLPFSHRDFIQSGFIVFKVFDFINYGYSCFAEKQFFAGGKIFYCRVGDAKNEDFRNLPK